MMRRAPSHRTALWRTATAGLLGAALSACAVGPDFVPPKPPATARLTPRPLPAQTVSANTALGEPQRFVHGMDIPAQWWALFGSRRLNARVVDALKANPNLAAAQAALRQARELADAQRGSYYPSVSAGFDASTNKTATAAVSPASATGSPYYALYTPQLSVSFVPDVFGLNRRTVESLDAQAENQRFQTEATYLTLTANVVTAAIQEASLRAQIEATEEVIRAETSLLVILQKQLSLGQISGADVAAQEAALAQSQGQLPPLRKQLAQQLDLETALLGRLPADAPEGGFTLADIKLPQKLPVSVPASLVAQRPDVRAAEATLHSASAEVGVAVANRLPQISLTAALGYSSNQLGNMIAPGTSFWTLAGALTQPVFQGFTLLHRQRAAEAALEQSAAQYRATVITAFQNVADALQAMEHDATALKAAVASEAAAAHSLTITRSQLALGAVSYPSLLNAQQAYQTSRLALAQARANRLSDTAALFQSLGGGWWNRPERDDRREQSAHR